MLKDRQRRGRVMLVTVGARTSAVLLAVSAVIVSGCAHPGLDGATGPDAAAAVLPDNAVIPLSAVQQVFPTLSVSLTGGHDPRALGAPLATRRAQFAEPTAIPRLTVTVAEYVSEDDAFTTFTDLIEVLRNTPGSVGLGRPDVGQDSRANVIRPRTGPLVVTVAARKWRMIIQVSTTRSTYSRDHLERLVKLARQQVSIPVSVAGVSG